LKHAISLLELISEYQKVILKGSGIHEFERIFLARRH
ncbi:hypothetical protein T4A_11448, partial [Trichinella pseudospiralis]